MSANLESTPRDIHLEYRIVIRVGLSARGYTYVHTNVRTYREVSLYVRIRKMYLRTHLYIPMYKEDKRESIMLYTTRRPW